MNVVRILGDTVNPMPESLIGDKFIIILEKKMKIRLSVAILLCTLLTWTGLAQAQTAAHYPAGAEGIKGPQLPPPGFYLRDYNYIYFADEFPEGPPEFDLAAYIQAPRLVWITNRKVLGGFYGMDILIPFAYQDLDFTGFGDSDFDLSDIFVEPMTISWHEQKFDAAIGYGFWAPTGDFTSSMADIDSGKGFWSHMLTGGVTYYPDEAKTWSISALNRWEFKQKRDIDNFKAGQYWTIDWGVAKSITPTFELGLAGYHQMAVTDAKVNSESIPDMKDHATALGPEVTFAFPANMFFISARYLFEVDTSNRPEGTTVNVTFTKKF
jgi:hypothetical protein